MSIVIANGTRAARASVSKTFPRQRKLQRPANLTAEKNSNAFRAKAQGPENYPKARVPSPNKGCFKASTVNTKNHLSKATVPRTKNYCSKATDLSVNDHLSKATVSSTKKQYSKATDFSPHEEFLNLILDEFLNQVAPFDSGLIDHLRQEDLLSEDEEDEVRVVNLRKEQARTLWCLLHKLPEDKFWKKCVPLLKEKYPLMITEEACSLETSAAEQHLLCIRHTIRRKIPLKTIADILVQSSCIRPEIYKDFINDAVPQGKRWSKLFSLLQKHIDNNEKLLKKVIEVLKEHKQPADVKREIESFRFSCVCSSVQISSRTLAGSSHFNSGAIPPYCPDPSSSSDYGDTDSLSLASFGSENTSLDQTPLVPFESDKQRGTRTSANCVVLNSGAISASCPDTASSSEHGDTDSLSLASFANGNTPLDQTTLVPFESDKQKDLYTNIRLIIDRAIETFAEIRPLYRKLEKQKHKCSLLHTNPANGQSDENEDLRLTHLCEATRATYEAIKSVWSKALNMAQKVSALHYYQPILPEFWYQQLIKRKNMLDLEKKEAAEFLNRTRYLVHAEPSINSDIYFTNSFLTTDVENVECSGPRPANEKAKKWSLENLTKRLLAFLRRIIARTGILCT